MSEEIFLIDANSLITPYLNYYPLDLAPGFWNQLESAIKNGNVVILDMVKNEILQGNDLLTEWMKNMESEVIFIDHRDPRIIAQYSLVLQYIQDDCRYKISALTEWAQESVADPWLIATAAVYHYTLITFEESNRGLDANNPSKRAKIPDVAREFG